MAAVIAKLALPFLQIQVEKVGYSGYESCRQNGIQRLACWAHERRKFYDVAHMSVIETAKQQKQNVTLFIRNLLEAKNCDEIVGCM